MKKYEKNSLPAPRWRSGLVMVAALLLLAFMGCGRATAPPSDGAAPANTTVSVVKPKKQAVRRSIEQPGHVEAFEQTPLHARVPGYVCKVNVDIGDPVEEGQVLAELDVPELAQELQQKEALVMQAKAEVGQAKAALAAARANVKTAEASVTEAQAGRRRAQASYDRWESEYKRFKKMVAGKAIDEQTLDEALNQFRAADAARDEVEAKVQSAGAARDESAARRDKAEADVAAAEARQKVAEAEARRLEALVQFSKVKSPFNGIVTRRYIDTGHFLQPAASSTAQPLFVVTRSDPARVFVEVPETEAALVTKGQVARVRIQALKGQEFRGEVTRTSHSLDAKSRTLRAEIDLPNPDGKLLPGMYAYATITVERPDVSAVPAGAVVTQGEQTVCFCVENGKAVRTQLRVGLSGGGLVEILKKQTSPAKPGAEAVWEDFTGGEEIVSTNASALVDGQAVVISGNTPQK